MEKIAAVVLIALVVGAIVSFLVALPVMLLWNAVVPDLFGLTQITFWQALALSCLCSLLFKSSGSSKKD